ncbi:tetratricopeptide repeat protein [bacterium]|nr:tetratricopeptide repeat protein [bacterium]
MELTVDQALQQGVAAHKEGKLQDAERLYRAILQAQPQHPDANHNLGVLAVAVSKPLEAIPLLQLALEANPKIEQFWLSYIDALITVERFDEARRVLAEGEKSCVSSEKLDALNQRLQASVTNDTNKSVKGQTLSAKRKRLAEQKKSKKRKVQGDPSSAEPSQDQVNYLLEHYQAGRLEKVEALAISLTQQFPIHPFGWKALGAVLKQMGRLGESLAPMQSAVKLSPQDAEAHSNLGVTLKELGRLDEAEASYRQAIALKPDYAEAHNSLGVTLQELGRLDEAEASCRQAITLKPDYAKAHSNLGSTLQELGRLDEAEASHRQAIALKPDYAEAHNNLGVTLQELGRLDEAEASCRQAITLKPDYAKAHSNLGINFYSKGDIDAAIDSLKKALDIEPKFRDSAIVLSVLRARRAREVTENGFDHKKKTDHNIALSPNPLFLTRVVEPELVLLLLEMQSRAMDEADNTPVFGNGTCSLDYNLFDSTSPIIKALEMDLISLMETALKSKIHIEDSFFNIYAAGAGIPPHNHLSELDKNHHLNLAKQKFSLVYYISVGDQDCNEPGILKLYDPEEDVLPRNGMIVTMPAARRHSAVYRGKEDRIIIGVNFYSI